VAASTTSLALGTSLPAGLIRLTRHAHYVNRTRATSSAHQFINASSPPRAKTGDLESFRTLRQPAIIEKTRQGVTNLNESQCRYELYCFSPGGHPDLAIRWKIVNLAELPGIEPDLPLPPIRMDPDPIHATSRFSTSPPSNRAVPSLYTSLLTKAST